MWGLLLAILAAVCWGLAPVAAKLALSNVSPMVGMTVRSLFATCLVGVWMAFSGHYRWVSDLGPRTLFWLLIEAILATVVGDALYFYALKQSHAGQVSLIMATSPLITLLVAVLLLGEPVTTAKLIGAVMVIAGLLLIGI